VVSIVNRLVHANRSLSHRLAGLMPGLCGEADVTYEFDRLLADAIRGRRHPKILEVGGGDRPHLSRSGDYIYHGVDIDDRESCKEKYDEFFVQSIEDPLPQRYDIIFSNFLLEHVRDNRRAFQCIFGSLQEGGITLHYVPSKRHPYSLATRAVGPNLQRRLIRLLKPSSVGHTGYPVFFHRCCNGQMRSTLREVGFLDIKIQCFFGASEYFAWCVPLFVAVNFFNRSCERLNLSTLASGMIVHASK
jgi:SAM-dependent methyltransferase